jgi:outer membrane lipoprotein-sorting protein
MRRTWAILGTAALLASAPVSSEDLALTTRQLTGRMARMDQVRATALHRYTVKRRYTLDNVRFHTHAEMTVKMTYTSPGKKDFEVLTETGSGWVRYHVFRRLMQAEVEGARDSRKETSIIPDNYDFRLLGTDPNGGHPCYVLEAKPKTKNKYLFRGSVWVDVEDAAVARIEGSPSQNPSFWTTKVHFVHRYQKVGAYWLAASNVSETEVRVFGPTELKIDYFDYAIN